MKAIPEVIAFVSLVAVTTYLEVHDKPTSGLWVLIVIWAVVSNWGQK